MTDINEYECEMLDTLLQALGIPDSLTRAQLVALFDDDESLAFSMVQTLLREDLVMVSGRHGDFDLPERLILKPKGDKFLQRGGFLERYHTERQKPVEVGGTLAKLQQQNMRLQHLKLSNEADIKKLEKELATLQVWRYIGFFLIVAALLLGFILGRL
jgi:hypothetical protein